MTASNSRGRFASTRDKSRRRAHDVRDETQQTGIGAQKRKQLHASGQCRQKAVETGERTVRVCGLGQGGDEGDLDFR